LNIERPTSNEKQTFIAIFTLMNKGHRNNLERNLDPTEARNLLERGARVLGLDLAPDQIDRFLTYLDLLLKWNRKMNLTALRSPREIIIHHFLDSLLLLPYLPETGNLLDLGSGAGFPGIPLKIARPGLTIDLVEATAKKASFLKEVIRCLGLSEIAVRPVFLGKSPMPFEPANPWEVFLSRGVNLRDVLKAVGPYWGSRQRLMLMKGKDWEKEISGLAPLLKKMEIIVDQTVTITPPLSEREWVLVILKKSNHLTGLPYNYYTLV
jgi:16S rRNA (guanine527-N7)-methyltransferase